MRRSAAFTLVELLVVMVIVAILAGMVMAALGGAQESARVQRAQQQIAKIDQLISEKWNSYRYRQVPVRIPANYQPKDAARIRNEALRELMKLEMPDRMSDINPAVSLVHLQTRPSLSRAYERRVTAAGVSYGQTALEQAECLYMILREMRDGDRSALNFFMSSEIGDTDDDGLPEILDPWGNPIVFLRWAPGYSNIEMTNSKFPATAPNVFVELATMQHPGDTEHKDPFDPLATDPRWNIPNACQPFELRPLILSAGSDGKSDIYATLPGGQGYRATPVTPNDPYVIIDAWNEIYVSTVDQPRTKDWVWIGTAVDMEEFVKTKQLLPPKYHGDNITNHDVTLND